MLDHLTQKNVKSLGLVVLTSLLLLGYTDTDKTGNTDITDNKIEITEHIRLYSNGQLIGEWEGIGRGQMNGDTYTFRTERGAFSDEMRIKGDFIIERSSQ